MQTIKTRLQLARKEIAINRIDELYPKQERGNRACTWQRPMDLLLVDLKGRWSHPDEAVKETDYDSDYYIEYKCHCCGHKWKSEMPD